MWASMRWCYADQTTSRIHRFHLECRRRPFRTHGGVGRLWQAQYSDDDLEDSGHDDVGQREGH